MNQSVYRDYTVENIILRAILEDNLDEEKNISAKNLLDQLQQHFKNESIVNDKYIISNLKALVILSDNFRLLTSIKTKNFNSLEFIEKNKFCDAIYNIYQCNEEQLETTGFEFIKLIHENYKSNLFFKEKITFKMSKARIIFTFIQNVYMYIEMFFYNNIKKR